MLDRGKRTVDLMLARNDPFAGLPHDFQIGYVDPPWEHDVPAPSGTADQHYDCLSLDQIKALPVGDLFLRLTQHFSFGWCRRSCLREWKC